MYYDRTLEDLLVDALARLLALAVGIYVAARAARAGWSR